MWLMFGGLLAVAAAMTLSRARSLRGPNTATLGWMSEQWLAEHRASHPS
jgi:hypothetical protein